MKKLFHSVFNNLYFSMFYLLLSLIYTTTATSIPGLGLLAKVGILWGVAQAFYNIYQKILSKKITFDILLYVFLILSLAFIFIKYPSGENIKIWIINLILLLGIFNIHDKENKSYIQKNINIFSNTYIVATLFLSLTSIVMNLFVENTIKGSFGLYSNINSFGIVAALSIIISLYMYLISKNKGNFKYLYLITSLFQLYCLYLSKCRSALLALLVIPLLFIFIKLKSKLAKSLYIGLPIIAIIAVALFEKEYLLAFSSGRNELWHNAYLVFQDNFLFGVGNSSLVQSIIDIRPTTYLPGLTTGGVHNIYLQLFATQGIILSLIFLSFIITAIYSIINYIEKCTNKLPYIMITSVVLGILLINLLESNILYIVSFISIIFWFYLGSILSITKKAE